mmetsp:Transcript_92307/g.183275  ORF Transcript_92307/g.183275 Transcript_92307/m.183275 type:complete len:226 (-) Transcript_92307:1046-1723(-)
MADGEVCTAESARPQRRGTSVAGDGTLLFAASGVGISSMGTPLQPEAIEPALPLHSSGGTCSSSGRRSCPCSVAEHASSASAEAVCPASELAAPAPDSSLTGKLASPISANASCVTDAGSDADSNKESGATAQVEEAESLEMTSSGTRANVHAVCARASGGGKGPAPELAEARGLTVASLSRSLPMFRDCVVRNCSLSVALLHGLLVSPCSVTLSAIMRLDASLS